MLLHGTYEVVGYCGCRRTSTGTLLPRKALILFTLMMLSSISARKFAAASSNFRKSSTLAFCSSRTSSHSRTRIGGVMPSPYQQQPLVACFASKADKGPFERKGKKVNPQKKITKWKINPNIKQENVDALSKAFGDLAKEEGFDDTTAHFADEDTFEEDFDYDLDDDGDDAEGVTSADMKGKMGLNPDDFTLDDFQEDDDDDDFLDFGSDTGGDDMDARIAAAQSDMGLGRVSVSKELDKFATDVSPEELARLGYKQELNPYGSDETPRRDQFKLITNALQCSACGADFQSYNDTRPGYLPSEKHQTQIKLSKIEDLQNVQAKADAFEWSPEDEIEWLIQTSEDEHKAGDAPNMDAKDIDVSAAADDMGLDLAELAEKKIICKRCHGLQNFGTVDETLRPGWTNEPLLSQERFRDLLRPIREKPAVIVALVDLFDFSGSVLPELDAIAGENPVVLVANKADLLPSEMGQTRAENWVRRELEYMGIRSIANIGGAVRLVSCKTGFGIEAMLKKARDIADEIDGDIYVVGAANAGKSTLLNFVLERNAKKKESRFVKKRAGNSNARKGEVTVSPLPGTTLKFIKVDIGDGRSLYDTPGLLTSGSLTQLLTPEELKVVVPKKQVEPITFRVNPGKCVLVGGLARIEVLEDSLPFMFTFFVANDIKLHVTDVSKADDYIAKHAGGMLTPPLDPGPERMEQIGEFETHDINIEGTGWKEAAADITLRGLGWVAVTGPGTAKVRVSVPKGIGISVRPPLMPMDVWSVASKYTGGRAIRKGGKTKSGKNRKGVGRN